MVKLSEEEYKKHSHEMKDISYQEVLGLLMYAVVDIRSNHAFAVSVICRFMSKLDPMHWMAVKRILQYKNGTLDMRLRISNQHINIKGYSDEEWASDVKTVCPPLDMFSSLESGAYCRIANDNKWWHNLQ